MLRVSRDDPGTARSAPCVGQQGGLAHARIAQQDQDAAFSRGRVHKSAEQRHLAVPTDQPRVPDGQPGNPQATSHPQNTARFPGGEGQSACYGRGIRNLTARSCRATRIFPSRT